MKKSEQTIADIKKLMTPRLSKLGSVRTDDAWQICKSDPSRYGGYCTISNAFRVIMKEMVKNGQADFIKNGIYFIHKPIK